MDGIMTVFIGGFGFVLVGMGGITLLTTFFGTSMKKRNRDDNDEKKRKFGLIMGVTLIIIGALIMMNMDSLIHFILDV